MKIRTTLAAALAVLSIALLGFYLRFDAVLVMRCYDKPVPYGVVVWGISLKRGVPHYEAITTDINRWFVIRLKPNAESEVSQ